MSSIGIFLLGALTAIAVNRSIEFLQHCADSVKSANDRARLDAEMKENHELTEDHGDGKKHVEAFKHSLADGGIVLTPKESYVVGEYTCGGRFVDEQTEALLKENHELTEDHGVVQIGGPICWPSFMLDEAERLSTIINTSDGETICRHGNNKPLECKMCHAPDSGK